MEGNHGKNQGRHDLNRLLKEEAEREKRPPMGLSGLLIWVVLLVGIVWFWSEVAKLAS